MNNAKKFIVTGDSVDGRVYWSTEDGGTWVLERDRAKEYKLLAWAEQIAGRQGGTVEPAQQDTPPAPAEQHTFLIQIIVNEITDEIGPGHSYYALLMGLMAGLPGDIQWRLAEGQAIGDGMLTAVETPEQLDAYDADVMARLARMPYQFRYGLTFMYQQPPGWPNGRMYGAKAEDGCKWCGKSAKRVGDGKLHDGYCQDHVHMGQALGRVRQGARVP